MSQIKNVEEIVSKTIKSVDTSCANVWRIFFTDDTNIEIWAEVESVGYTTIPILVSDTEEL